MSATVKKRLYLSILLACLFLFPFALGGARPALRIPDLMIQWNAADQKFEALFRVINQTDKDLELSCILRFQNEQRRRWRGALLPLIPKSSSGQFKIKFPPDLMLKNDYTDVSVILYEKRYRGFLDNSNNYVRIKTQRFIVDNQYRVTLFRTVLPEKISLEPVTTKKVITLGPVEVFRPSYQPEEKKPVKLQALVVPPTEAPKASQPIAEKKREPEPESGKGRWIVIDPTETQKTALQQAIDRKEAPELFKDLIPSAKPEAEPGAPPEAERKTEEVPREAIEAQEPPSLTPPAVELVEAADGDVVIKWTSTEMTSRFNLYWSDIPLITRENSTQIPVTGNSYTHKDLINGKRYYYAVSAVVNGRESALSNEIEAVPEITAIVETPIEVLLSDIYLDEFNRIEPIDELRIDISDTQIAKQETLKRAQRLKATDIESREKLISLYIAEGKSEEIAEVLADQLDRDPDNLNLSLSLSKVYHEQGDTSAALDVLTASLNRISLSARLALNQELKTSVREGETTIQGQSEEAFLANEFSRLGLSLLEEGKYTDALSAFQSLYSLARDYPLLQYYMGKCREGLKQYNQAKRYYIAQSRKEIDTEKQLITLNSLTDVLPNSLELRDVDYTIGQYKELISSVDQERQNQISQQLDKLDLLRVSARDKRLGNLADLQITLPEPFQLNNIQPGQDIVVKLAVENIGRIESAEFNVNYQLRHENGVFYEIPEIDRFKPIAANGDPYIWDKKITIPEKAIEGQYQLVVNIEQAGGSYEVSLSNNTLTTAASIAIIQPIAELAITFREQPTQAKVNRQEGVILDLIITNHGYLPSPAFNIVYRLESEAGNSYSFTDPRNYNKIPKRDRLLIERKSIALPEDFPEGLYKIEAQLKLDNEAAEIIKSNNRVESAYTFRIPDRFEGRPQDGIDHYRRMVLLEPDKLRHRVKLSRYYRILEQDDQALSVLNQASVYVAEKRASLSRADTSPFSTRHLKLLKRELKKTGDQFAVEQDYQRSLTSYQSLQTLDPDYPQINRYMAHSRIGLGQYALAKKAYKAQVNQTFDLQSLADLKNALSFGNDVENMKQTRDAFIRLRETSSGEDLKTIDRHIAELNQMIENTQQLLAQQGSDLIIDIENPPGLVAIKPRDTLELEFSLINLGKTLSNAATVHYQFISQDGNVYDTDRSTGFERLDPRHGAVYWDEELPVPENIIGGTYQVRASLEFEKNRADKDETNNRVLSDFLFVYSEPDIVITGFSHRVKQILPLSNVVTTQLTWENQGGNPAGNNQLRIYLENTADPSDIQLLKEEAVTDVPALSETIVMSHDLEIDAITTDKTYQLVAEIRSRGEFTENTVYNNRMASAQLIGKDITPIAISGLTLNSRISYPGKKVDLEVRLRNNQLEENINGVRIELSLQNPKGVSCCAVVREIKTIPPSFAVSQASERETLTSEGTDLTSIDINVSDYIFKDSLEFPGISKGQYQLQARLLSTEQIERIETNTPVTSQGVLFYGDPTFQIASFYPIRDVLIPGKENFFTFTVQNSGKDLSKPETVHLYLEGKQLIYLGKTDIEPLEPSEQAETLGKFVKIPDDLDRGSYSLLLKKKESSQSAAQTLRYRHAVTIHDIQQIAPQEFESFKRNEVPLFTWDSVDDLSYRLVFSTDPQFKDQSRSFRIPDENWLEVTEYQPQTGEWRLIWLLSQQSKRDVYWQVEAKSAQNDIIKGIPQKILLKSKAF